MYKPKECPECKGRGQPPLGMFRQHQDGTVAPDGYRDCFLCEGAGEIYIRCEDTDNENS